MRFNNFWCYRSIVFSRKFLRTLRASRCNVLADTRGRNPSAGPYMAEFDITYRCNCRCLMCQRWNDLRREALSVSDYARLAEEFEAMAVHQISIAGGEPLMRADVFDIMSGFARRGLSVNLCTNGMLLEKYCRQIMESGITCVTVSLDGATAHSHDTIRGVRGSHDRIEAGIRRYLSIRHKHRPLLRVRMTVSQLNQNEINAFYHKWNHLADDVLLQPVHNCSDAYYTGIRQTDLELDPDVLQRQLQDTGLSRDGYMSTFIESLRRSGEFPDFRCFAGVLMARIDPWGNVYPCLEQHTRVGSVLNDTFCNVWHSKVFTEERRRLRSHRTCRCWFNNTALIGHYGSWLQKSTLGSVRTQLPHHDACDTGTSPGELAN